MGARKVLRRLAGIGVVVAALVAPAYAGDEPVIVVDLRDGDAEALRTTRAELIAGMGAIQGIVIKQDPGLDGALAGEASDTDAGEVMAALDEARAAYGDLDCAKASAAANRAIDLLAARQASGLDDGNALRGSWAIALLCADQAGDRTRAQGAADHLRALGVTRGDEIGVSEQTWERFPEIDARVEGAGVALTVTTEPAGAAVWIDHVSVGVSPATVYLLPGEHVVAAGEHARRASARVAVGGEAATAALTLVDRTGEFSSVAGVVKGWRDGALTPTAEALGTVMERLSVRFALVLTGKKTVQVWARSPEEDVPHKVDDASRDDLMGVAAMITDRVAAWDGNAPDPDHPLLRETPGERDARKGTPQKWWVYAAIVGAVALGSGILYLQDAADDHQTITLHFP